MLTREASSKSGKTKRVNEVKPSRRVSVLHQSDYVASGYMLVPQKTFSTTQNDFPYIKLCLQKDVTGMFQVEPKNFSFLRHRILSYLPFNLGERQRFEVEGPDNFCDVAVNFPAMFRDLSRVQSGDKAIYGYVIGRDDKGDDYVSETAEQGRRTALFNEVSSETNLCVLAKRYSRILVEYAGLIKTMRE